MMMRVLHISHSAALSGAEQALLRVLGAMDRARFESIVVLPEDGPLRARLEPIGVETRVLPIRWWIPATDWTAEHFARQLDGLETRWRDLAELAARERIDLIHSNTLVTIEGALAANALGIPHTWHSRGSFGQGFPPRYADDPPFFFSIVEELGGALVCVSNSVLVQTRQYARDIECHVMPDGFDLEPSTAPAHSDLRSELDLPGNSRLIACIGGIQRRKGQIDLVDAIALARKAHPSIVLLLVGPICEASYGSDVRDRVTSLGLSQSVRLLGFRNDVASIIGQCELIVHPSYSEGFPLSILEAMAAGKPVVATRCGGAEDMIEDGISGILVSPARPEQLAQAIGAMLGDAVRARELGNAARERAKLFRVSSSAGRLQDIFSDVLRGSPSRSPDPARANAVTSRIIMASRDCSIASLRSELEHRDRIIAARDEAIDFLKEEVSTRDAIISARDDGISFLKERVVSCEAEIRDLREAIQKLQSGAVE